MHKFLIALMTATFFITTAHAGPQQERMKECNKEAGDKALKGDERKQFMKNCLSGKKADAPEAAAEPSAQQNRMKTCNKEAGDKALKGDERKKFMSECLKK